jgi:hypothetical protein
VVLVADGVELGQFGFQHVFIVSNIPKNFKVTYKYIILLQSDKTDKA